MCDVTSQCKASKPGLKAKSHCRLMLAGTFSFVCPGLQHIWALWLGLGADVACGKLASTRSVPACKDGDDCSEDCYDCNCKRDLVERAEARERSGEEVLDWPEDRVKPASKFM